jgi:SPASM domain peptide maturase of grasp-with-spasm system
MIPNDLFEILTKIKRLKIRDILSEYGDDNIKIINDYFKNLENLELGFYCNETELDFFPDLNLDYHSPFEVNNAILENFDLKKDYLSIINQLEEVGCEYLEAIFYDEVNNNDLVKFLDYFDNSSIKYVGLIIKDNKLIDNNFFKKITQTKLRVTKILLHSSKRETEYDFEEYNLTNIIAVKQTISSFKFCGNFNEGYFTPNMNHFTESQNHNTCLNKKIAIDREGNIKNCPAFKDHFGNVKTTNLKSAILHPSFKKLWNISKDQIGVCKDCEFRHVCTDCRAFTEEPDDQYSKPLKCGYNPYTNEWVEWSTNPLKEKAIEHYCMQDLVKKDA